MSVYGGPIVVRNQLIHYHDTVNLKSYPGSGDTWYDLSGNGLHLLFNKNITGYSQPTPAWAAPGYFTFDKTIPNIGYIPFAQFYNVIGNTDIANSLSVMVILNCSALTVSGNMWAHSNLQDGVIVQRSSDNKLGYTYGNGSTSDTAYSSALTLGRWYIMTVTRDVNNITWYMNGVQDTQTANSIGTVAVDTNNNFRVGSGASGLWSGKLSVLAAWDKTLTAAEILQNFQALRGRYGL